MQGLCQAKPFYLFSSALTLAFMSCKLFNEGLTIVLQTNYNVPGGRLSPSVSEADLRNPVESVKLEVGVMQIFQKRDATVYILGIRWLLLVLQHCWGYLSGFIRYHRPIADFWHFLPLL